MSQKSPKNSVNSGGRAAIAGISRPANGETGARLFSDSLLTAMLSFRGGDFSVRMPANLIGIEGKIADAFNDIVAFSDRRSKETVRVSSLVGKEGKLKQRMYVPEGLGGWVVLTVADQGVAKEATKGDLIIEVQISVPDKLSEEQERMMKEFAEAGGLKY